MHDYDKCLLYYLQQPQGTDVTTASNANLHHSLPAAAHLNPVTHENSDKPLPVTYTKGKVRFW
jgi:hypothetical protein